MKTIHLAAFFLMTAAAAFAGGPSATLGAPPPKGAVVLFDGKNMDAWTRHKNKEWLTPDGPSRWKITNDGALELVPGAGSIITRRLFGDCKLHLEFRTLVTPTNSGVYLQTRYEVKINETFGDTSEKAKPCGYFANCDAGPLPSVNAALAKGEWQTLDIDFHAPRFDATGKKKTEPARATVRVNGARIYDNQELGPPRLAAGKLGETPRGPLYLKEHGDPVQYRNIWLVDLEKAE
jgi:hypothetical protein